MRMRHIAICGLPGCTMFLLHCHINSTIFFLKKVTEYKICFFLFSPQLMSEKCLILKSNDRDMIKNVNWSSCKILVILARFLMEHEFSRVGRVAQSV
jgi:hypothetical protein